MTTPTHAGGILFRGAPDAVEYLLVQAKHNPEHWVFPKGHIEPGETPEQAAVREVREEAGVEGEILAHVRTSSFAGPRGPVDVVYYLMRFRAPAVAEEDRETIWCPLEAALTRLTFPDARDCLVAASSLVTGTGGQGGRGPS